MGYYDVPGGKIGTDVSAENSIAWLWKWVHYNLPELKSTRSKILEDKDVYQRICENVECLTPNVRHCDCND
jgi:hypothetical protein